MRRIVTEPKAGFTGVVLVASFARFRPLIAIFREPRPDVCVVGSCLPWPKRTVNARKGRSAEAMRKNKEVSALPRQSTAVTNGRRRGRRHPESHVLNL